MHVERYGRGADAYFGLHGWSGDHTTYAPLAPFVPARASLFSADLPGCGRSPRPRAWSLDALADEVAAAVSEAAPTSVTLVGTCSGAVLALLAATRLPGRVERLVLVDPFAYMPWYFRIFCAGELGRRAYGATFANPLGRWATNQSLRGRRTPETDLTGGFRGVDHDAALSYLRLFAGAGRVDEFRDVRVPVDLLYGAKTFGAVKRSVALWRGVWPHARAWRLDGAGHLPIREAPERVGAILFGGEAG